ncbi:hypothetical protein [Nonomuraea basaltis]|uniref:hypothetical protein n=1 Tax=Nonomuraea basaltis TaxID=2495887 RepID=UPI00110C4293|nr:hypothetical protein [Nonomuraea basaltis]TMR98364.1 hypothetical protein EJK15_13550 [Nonomuraea basaltis]
MGKITVKGAGLRRAAYLGAAFLSVVLIMVGLYWLSPSEEERFARSAGQMEIVARTLGEGNRLGPRKLGDLTFEDVYREDGVVFFQQGRLAEDPYGYAWSPKRQLADFAGELLSHSFKHEHGPWYAWRGIT